MNIDTTKRNPIIHPFLFAVFPILSLFVYNIEQISFSCILSTLAVSLTFAFLMMLALRFFLKDHKKAAIITTLFLIIFFSYGYTYSIVRDYRLSNFQIGRHRYLMLISGILFSCGIFSILKMRKNLRIVNRILNIASIILVAFSFAGIAIYGVKTINAWKYTGAERTHTGKMNLCASKNAPDVYYIILDAYAGLNTLKQFYGYDNRSFIDYLARKGFYVATDSRSNYVSTILSLSASLNMKYLNWLTDAVGKNSEDTTIPYQMIHDSTVVNNFKSLGYTFMCFGNGWKMKGSYEVVAQDFKYGILNEFQIMLIQTTLLRPFFDYFFLSDVRRERILWIFKKLPEIHKIDTVGGKFVFVHIVCPHPPFVFGPNGERLPFEKDKSEINFYKQKQTYLNQLIFVNKNVEKIIDQILAESKTKPIIILQSDHGPSSTFPSKIDEWPTYPSEDMIKERMGILNVYYFPAGDYNLLRRSLTPVNSFRLIFNLYFGGDYKLLEDKSYYSTYKHPYKFVDTADILKSK